MALKNKEQCTQMMDSYRFGGSSGGLFQGTILAFAWAD